MDSQDFEKIQVVKFQSVLRDFCCLLPSLKQASKYQAIFGITLSIIILVAGTGGNFLLFGLSSDQEDNERSRDPEPRPELYLSIGIILFIIGTLLLIYNLVLLLKVRANRGVGVYKTIKIGCLISLYTELIVNFSHIVLLSFVLPSDGTKVGILLVQSLFLLLTASGIYGIHGLKPRIVSAFIYFKGIFYALAIIIFLVAMIYGGISVFYILIIPFILFLIFTYYYLKILVLQVNLMLVSQGSPHHQQLINASEDKV